MSEHASFDEAFLAAQGEFPEVPKDKENPHFKSRYSSLDAIKSATRPALNKHGITTTERTDQADGRLKVTAILRHVPTGQEVTNSAAIDEATSVQGLGSQITYLRRYALVPLLGICSDEDDDGHAGNAAGRVERPAKKPAEKKTFAEQLAERTTAAEVAAYLQTLVGRRPVREHAAAWTENVEIAGRDLVRRRWSVEQTAIVAAVIAGIRNTLADATPAREPEERETVPSPPAPAEPASPKIGDPDKAPSLERLAGWTDNLDSAQSLLAAFASIEASDKFADLRAHPERMLDIVRHAKRSVAVRPKEGAWSDEACHLVMDELDRLEVKYDLSRQVTAAFQGAPS